MAAKGEGFSARRITVTRPDGQEPHRLVWVEHDSEDQIEDFVEEILQNPIFSDNPQLQEALVAKLTERVLMSASEDNMAQRPPKRQKRKYKGELSGDNQLSKRNDRIY